MYKQPLKSVIAYGSPEEIFDYGASHVPQSFIYKKSLKDKKRKEKFMNELKLKEKVERLDDFIGNVMNIVAFIFEEDVPASCTNIHWKAKDGKTVFMADVIIGGRPCVLEVAVDMHEVCNAGWSSTVSITEKDGLAYDFNTDSWIRRKRSHSNMFLSEYTFALIQTMNEISTADMSNPDYVLPLVGMSEEIYKAASAFDKYIAKQTLHEAFRTGHADSYVDEMNVGVDISENISASLSVVTPDATYMLLVCPDSDDDVIITAINGKVVDEYHVGDIGEATRTLIRIAGKIA